MTQSTPGIYRVDDLPDHLPTDHADVLVVGGGAGGFAAATTAAYHGLDVILAEQSAACGGATSRSGGWAWTPGTSLAKAEGVDEDVEEFRTYLRGVLGELYTDQASEMIDAFLEAVPHMVDFFHYKTALQFVTGAKINDIYGHLPGAGTGNRSVGPKPINARKLSKTALAKLNNQYYPTSFLGMGIMAGPDLQKILSASQFSLKGWVHSASRVIPHVWDMATHRRSMHLVNGTALMGRLIQSAEDLGVDIRVKTEVQHLIVDHDDAVVGAVVGTTEGGRIIRTQRGVVLATGGFPADVERRRQYFRHTPTGNEHWTLAPDEADGSGADLAEAVGGYLDTEVYSAAAWCPVSLVPYPNGNTGVFPHIMDRAKPGSIGVRKDGKRFVNEANGYFDYVDGLMQATPEGEAVESWQIADSTFVRKYPLGFAKPIPVPLLPYIRSGYLIKADTLEELARKTGIDPVQLVATVQEFNANARRGEDPEFQRGETAFNRYGGDQAVTPNPSLAPIEKGPFYAVHVRPGSFGTFAGIAADTKARVLNRSGQPIRGLYAAGNDMVSIMRGKYPSGGVNIGPALTFGYIAGRDLAQATEYEVTSVREVGSEK